MVHKSTQIWKLIYGLTTIKEGEIDPPEVKQDEKDEERKDDKDDDKEDDSMEEYERIDNTIGEEIEK